MKKKISLISYSLIPVAFSPLLVVISCSDAAQNEANQYYRLVYNESLETKVGKSDIYAQSVYDAESFLNSISDDSEIKKIPNNFELVVSEFNYLDDGRLDLKINLKEKNSNRILEPKWDRKEDFFTNSISVKGFKNFSHEEKTKLEDEYQKINDANLVFNKTGVETILKWNQNLNEHINFDNLNDSKNITKMFENFGTKATNNSEYQINKIVTEGEPIQLDEKRSELTFKFKFLLSKKNDATKILNAVNNDFKVFTVPYKIRFSNQLHARDFDEFKDKKANEVLSTVNQSWIFTNKEKLFTQDSQQLIKDQSWITDVKVKQIGTDNAISIDLKFGINSEKQELNQVIIGFKK